MTNEQIEAELRLFKAYSMVYDEYPIYESTCSVDKGLIYTATVSENIKSVAEKLYGIKPEQWNNTFHKSFQTVIDTPIEKLVAQQIIHYFTTYGLENIGLYDKDIVYIPHEHLDIPEIEEDVKLTVIKYIYENELEEKLMTLITSGIALSKQTVKDIIVLSDYIDKDRIDEIKNREVRIAMYDKYNVVPKNNMDFLRYVVYKTTEETLYIQSNDMIRLIKNSDKEVAYNLFINYIGRLDGYDKLGEIFLRNKNIFLAFKTPKPSRFHEKVLNNIINRIRRAAKKTHKPLKSNILDNLYHIKTQKSVSDNASLIESELDKISVFREIRIINGLCYRTKAYENSKTNSIVYRIRNGKIFASELDSNVNDRTVKAWTLLLYIIQKHLEIRLSKVFAGKTFYIPSNVKYAAPSSEKQFVGDIPEGSKISIPRKSNMVVGVHWYNLENARVDLDLKMLNLDESYGWNTAYLSDSSDIVFSGDITDAPKPKGATEVFLISPKTENKKFLLKLNDFTQVNDKVPFEFFVAELDDSEIKKNYEVNPNKIIMQTHNSFDATTAKIGHTSAKTLGYVDITKDTIDIYFKNFEDVKGRISNIDTVNKHIFNYTNLYGDTQLTLNDLIEDCGGKILDSNQKETLEEVIIDGEKLYKKIITPVDYDLSVENISKESIIKLFGE